MSCARCSMLGLSQDLSGKSSTPWIGIPDQDTLFPGTILSMSVCACFNWPSCCVTLSVCLALVFGWLGCDIHDLGRSGMLSPLAIGLSLARRARDI